MEGSIEELIKTLDNMDNGWVVRRDAAAALGKIALEAVTALSSHLKDRDMDVLIAVETCLETFKVVLGTPGKTHKEYSLSELARSCEKKGECEVVPRDKGYILNTSLPNGRRHRIYMMRSRSADGRAMVRVFTLCGRANRDYERWALKLNRKASTAAFALQQWNDEEYLMLVNNIPLPEATPKLIQERVREMASYGDWIEEKMEGTDEL